VQVKVGGRLAAFRQESQHAPAHGLGIQGSRFRFLALVAEGTPVPDHLGRVVAGAQGEAAQVEACPGCRAEHRAEEGRLGLCNQAE
jgi:hypothetical protein